uniref:Zinc finger protein RFP-like n=1 Tax=Pelodiscus sinensis TaxID=13735 RepID=K7FA61_PELSI
FAPEAMAAVNPAKTLQDEVTCPICLDYFNDPVSLDCDHNFCQACITQSWGGLTADVSCPQCRRAFPQGNLRPNRQLRSIVEAARELRLQAGRERAAERLCEKHQEPLKLFCREDEIPICLVCDRSKGHRGHTVIPAEEAAEEFQNNFYKTEGQLQKEKQLRKYFDLSLAQHRVDVKRTRAERQKIVAEFQQLRQFLKEQERLLLAQLQKLDEMIVKAQTDTVTKLSEQIFQLSELIGKLEKTYQKPASEFLQNIRSTLNRRLWNYSGKDADWPVVYSTHAPSRVTMERRFSPANVTLDPDTAHPQLLLHRDGKRVRWEQRRQPRPDPPERFDSVFCVLGREGFTSGRHCWEVEVGDGRFWAVGVARESVGRKGGIILGPRGGIWAVRWWGEEFQALTDPATPLSPSLNDRIRVCLDCDRGQVTF